MPKVDEPVDPQTYKEEYEARLAKTGVPFWPIAAWRDAVFSVAVMALIVGCAIIFGPPALGTSPNPSDINANPMPDWYFWWYFAILSMLPPELETYVILGLPVVGLLGLIVIPMLSNQGARAPSRRPWAVGTVVFSFTALVVLTIYGYRKPWSPDFGVTPLSKEIIASDDPGIIHGAALVHQKGCLYCHEIDGYGGHRGPELSDIGQRLTQADLIIRINNGGYNMPSFAASLNAQELADMVAFLQTRRFSPSPESRLETDQATPSSP